jgi:ribose 5-phosphate isomerase RpiB
MIPYEDFGTYTEESTDYPRIAEKVVKQFSPEALTAESLSVGRAWACP